MLAACGTGMADFAGRPKRAVAALHPPTNHRGAQLMLSSLRGRACNSLGTGLSAAWSLKGANPIRRPTRFRSPTSAPGDPG